MNRICLIGRITRDPELRITTGGKSVVDFSIAVDRKIKSQDGSPTADFFRVQAWEQTAKFVAEYLGKGRLIAVDGRLTSRKYTASDGTNREVCEVVADSVTALDRPKDDAATNPRGNAPRPAEEDEFDPFADE